MVCLVKRRLRFEHMFLKYLSKLYRYSLRLCQITHKYTQFFFLPIQTFLTCLQILLHRHSFLCYTSPLRFYKYYSVFM